MQQQRDPTSAPVTAVQEHEGAAVHAQGSGAANGQNASHITPQVPPLKVNHIQGM